jgi:hypothetical protein
MPRTLIVRDACENILGEEGSKRLDTNIGQVRGCCDKVPTRDLGMPHGLPSWPYVSSAGSCSHAGLVQYDWPANTGYHRGDDDLLTLGQSQYRSQLRSSVLTQ